MDRYQQMLEERSPTVVGAGEVGTYTKEFFQKADPRSLQGIIYKQEGEIPKGLEKAEELTINTGGKVSYGSGAPFQFRTDSADNLKELKEGLKQTAKFTEKLRDKGVDIETFGDPRSKTKVHTKLYIRERQGKKQAFVSTGNLVPSYFKARYQKESGVFSGIKDRLRQVLPFTRKPLPGGGNQEIKRFDLGVTYQDPEIVKEAKTYYEHISKNQIPPNQEHIKTNQAAINETVDLLEKAGKGDTVTVSSPFLQMHQIAGAMAGAQKRGAEVELLTNHPKGDSSRKKVIKKLKASGVDVINAGKDTFIHAKAVALKTAEGEYRSAIGSMNWSGYSGKRASITHQQEDILVFNQGQVSKQIFQKINSAYLNQRTQLYHSRIGEGRAYSGAEIGMLSKGLTHYRMGESNNMPYYPTSLSPSYFTSFKGEPLPKRTPYSDIYRARTGQEPPETIQALDEAMMSPGIGGRINRALGQTVYREDKGFIGSAVHSTGEFIDWTFGHDYTQEKARRREGDYSGSLGDFFKFSEQKPEDEKGIFEWALGGTYDLLGNMSYAVGTYVFLNLPLEHIRAKLASKPVEAMLTEDTEFRDTWQKHTKRGIARGARQLAFGQLQGNMLSEAIESVEDARLRGDTTRTVPEEYSRVVSEALQTQSQESRLYKLAEKQRDKGYVAWEQLSGGLYTTTMAATRRFEQLRFRHVLRPVLEAMNPYSYGTKEYEEYVTRISGRSDPQKASVEETIGKGPRIVFGRQGHTRPSLELHGIGSERVNEIYRSMEEIGHLIPLDPKYWFPPIRKALKLPEFDPQTQLTWSRVMPMKQASVFAENILKRTGSLLRKPQDTLDIWRNEFQARRAKQQLKQTLISDYAQQIQGRDIDEVVESTTQAYRGAIQELEGLEQTNAYQRYQRAQQRLEELVPSLQQQRATRDLHEEAFAQDSRLGASMTNNRETHKKAIRARRGLLTVGSLLFADKLVSDVLGGSGPSILTQFKAMWSLATSEEGQVARFAFEGNIPTALGVAGMATGYALGGATLPNWEDTGRSVVRTGSLRDNMRNRSDVLRTQLQTQSASAQAESRLASFRDTYHRFEDHRLARDTRLRFSHSKGFGAAIVAGLVAKIGSSALAGVGNLLFNTEGPLASAGRAVGSLFGVDTKEPGTQLQGPSAVQAMAMEDELVQAIKTADSRKAKTESILGKYILETNLTNQRKAGEVSTIARQYPIPFFQISAMGRRNKFKERIEFGVGAQFTPTSGLGIVPTLPLSLRLSGRSATHQEKVYKTKKRKGELDPLTRIQYETGKFLEQITFTHRQQDVGIGGFGDSGFVEALEFTGAVTMASAVGNLLTSTPTSEGSRLDRVKNTLYERAGRSESVRRELTALDETIGPFARGVKTLYGTADKLTSNLLALPFRVAQGIPEALKAFAQAEGNIDSGQGYRHTRTRSGKGTKFGALLQRRLSGRAGRLTNRALRRQLSTSRTVGETLKGISQNRLTRRTALLGLTYAFFSGVAQPGGGGPATLTDPVERFQGVAGATALVAGGFMLSGGLASQQEMAEKFFADWSVEEKKAELRELFPKTADRSGSLDQKALERAVDTGAKTEGRPRRNFFTPSRRVQALVASDYLIEQAWQSAGNKPDKLPRYGKGGGTVGGRLRLLGASALGAKLLAHASIATLPREWSQRLAETPFIGPTISLLTGYNPKPDLMEAYQRQDEHPAVNALGKVSRTLTFGYLDIPGILGMYKDKPEPYASTVGPFGISFKDAGAQLYAQFQGDATDFSLSSYKMVKYGLQQYDRMKEVLQRKEG
ncbi:MAG: phospholipase D-like domain-containing protein, partial [Halobacteria archaeon]